MLKSSKIVIYIVALLCLIIIVTYSCKDTLIQPTDEQSLKYISGKIANFDLGDSIIVKFERSISNDSVIVFDTAEVNKNGLFVLEANEPPNNLLIFRNGMQCTGLIFSDSTVKTYSQTFLHLYKNNIIIAGLYGSNIEYGEEMQVGDYFTSLMYAEEKLQVDGVCKGISGGKEYLMIHNFSLIPGWNRIVIRLKTKNDSLLVDERKVENNFNNSWYYWLY